MKFKVGQKIKYKDKYLICRPSEDSRDNIPNLYTVLEVDPTTGFAYIYPNPNPRGISGWKYNEFCWAVKEYEVELVKVTPEVKKNFVEYEEAEHDEFDEHCVAGCRPAQHKCGKIC